MGEDLSQIQESLRRSFQAIKQDILGHESKLKNLSHQLKTLSDVLSNTSKKKSSSQYARQISELKNKVTDIEKKLDSINQSNTHQTKQRSLKPLQQNIDELTQRMEKFERKLDQKPDTSSERILTKIDEKLSSFRQPQADIPSLVKEAVAQALQSLNQSQKKSQRDPETPFASRMIKKLERNKKDIIKQPIIEMVTQAPILLPELKEILVDEKQYCSKASFYRYIEDLLARGIIAFDQKGESNMVVLKGRARP